MSIRMIAVDMDGTFLDDRMRYDRQWFSRQYALLKARGIKFVVASGNQYFQLISFFPEIAGEIAFVAENGAYIVNGGREVFCGEISREHYARIIHTLAEIPYLETIVCAKECAYRLNNAEPGFYQQMGKYYHRLAGVDDFLSVSGTIFKFALSLPDEKLAGFMRFIDTELAGVITPVSSGHGSVDLIIPGVHKANGLRILQRLWDIQDHEVAAFGDGGNDIEMLQQAGFSYAMANAPDRIKTAARYQTSSNNDAGVLRVIDKLLQPVPGRS
ncbi:Cof-type HAD-IIB family hydrolase [Acerihabitans arboris]|uniref:Cof-type HAD-IIB family hydrolase n=1 Tax=Acerihabitans arboris TaxID=2691583 RepID=A0A845SQL2_9GAMM|nr:Cof-type HAD-IIB family hydrolase [Acerihabitans arboris]NDL63435.1 Cof-type HAD-IIB family hydrolase [Acerihabitans arboris]